jgi:glutamine amidotransferase
MMCRHFAWLGQPRTLAALVLEPEYGLRTQSYRPRRQEHGLLNADGWGVGFYRPGVDEPARWRSNRPLWSDASFQSVAPAIASHCVLGAVRSATIGMPLDESACAPFQSSAWLLSHNGVVDRDVLGPQAAAESVCDAAQLAAYVFARDPADVGKVVADIGRRDPGARLNLVLTDGRQVFATTWGDTLCTRRTDAGVLVASEPFDDDPEWTDVPDRCLVHVTGDRVTITELKG